jgi:hypothetical protein
MKIPGVLLAPFVLVLTGCRAEPYTMGMGAGTFSRYNRCSQFLRRAVVFIDVRVRGGGYDFEIRGPGAGAVSSLLMDSGDMAGRDGPTHVSVTGLAEANGAVVPASLEFGFDPSLVLTNKPSPRFGEELHELQRSASAAATDRRLLDLGSIMERAFVEHSIRLNWIDVAASGHLVARLHKQTDLLRVLAAFNGFRTESTDKAPDRQWIKVSVDYSERGKGRRVSETFQGSEEIKAEGREYYLSRLVRDLGLGVIPLPFELGKPFPNRAAGTGP